MTSQNSATDTGSAEIEQALKMRTSSVSLDRYAENALKLIVDETYAAEGNRAKATLKKKEEEGGLSVERITQLTKRIDNNGLDDTSRLLLSSSDIYASLIAQALGSVQPSDIVGLTSSVMLRVGGLPKRLFLAAIIALVTQDLQILITDNQNDPKYKQWARLPDLAVERGISIRAGQVRADVEKLLNVMNSEGSLPYYVNEYIKRSAIPATSFTPAVKQAMTDYLIRLGVQIGDDANFKRGLYDEYFILAYNEALKLKTVAEDPIDTARTKGGEVNWNFTIDSFETVDVQGVVPANIKAAGALDYIYYIGEGMRLFEVANALVLRWASGMLDIPEGKTAAALYRYHKLRNERNTPEERAMLYKRVLNKGNGRLLSNMVVNQAFPTLWQQLMVEVTEYIGKVEGSKSKEGWVSRSPMYQATKNLQYNLSEHMTGMSHVQVTEDYAHLQEALDILKADEIVGKFGGRRKSIWSVIEQIAKEDLGVAIPTSTLRSIAVEGNRVFQWVANFDESVIRENDFNDFLQAAEAWIIAQASLDSSKFLPAGAPPANTNRFTSQKIVEKNGSRREVKVSAKVDDMKDDDWDF